jgi:tRNA threonylcarbamoyl adenosine modification protein YjeE
LPHRRTVLLIGKLGAGKTTLAKGIVSGLGAAPPEEVSSPTFTLIHEYGHGRVYHVDLYRLEEPRELATLGLDEPTHQFLRWPQRELHVIVDNLNIHKPKHDRWVGRHPNVHFHFIPTHASWLNQVEIWFSLLSRHALRGASFTSVAQLRDAIDAFIAAYNPDAAPFEWTKREVRPVGPKHKYANLSN